VRGLEIRLIPKNGDEKMSVYVSHCLKYGECLAFLFMYDVSMYSTIFSFLPPDDSPWMKQAVVATFEVKSYILNFKYNKF
jgi:hypothetical protein